ncbi:MAG: bifunctional DNA-formamidopyrimidine glycosylase/DNA-(apurinic or apyrimidinic site) lyase [Bryobacterales bacterium]|nr:bifunctional DNA-formamidopyrimidine glycosylase/DNA-(apurinic or apyrimidinic site) lyase [Bryobacterales bacterium]
MPELPEVETVVRSLIPRLKGATIERVAMSDSRVFRNGQADLEARLPGSRILSVRRFGKNILFDLEPALLRIHLGMTGRLLFDPVDAHHVRAELWLAGATASKLVFDDVRHFGRFELIPGEDMLHLGPDPLEISRAEFIRAAASQQRAIKNVLLDQSFLRGMGNIYTDEALFRARIHPLTPASRVPRQKAGQLHEAMQAILIEAIERGGSSISDYLDAEGRRGAFQESHQVYRRTGLPCVRCGHLIERIVVAQRGTHYCPRCQR